MTTHVDPFTILDRLAQALLFQSATERGWQPGSVTEFARLANHRKLAEAIDASLVLPLNNADPALIARTILDEEPYLSSHIKLIKRCAEALPNVLSGQITGKEVIFPDGSMNLLAPIYEGNTWADKFNRRAAEAVARAAVALAKERRETLRIIEIGAGTGGTTNDILPALNRACYEHKIDLNYVYTDISVEFIDYGRNRFAYDYPFLSFAKMDIEQSPVDQGFDIGKIDIVVAANVLHATAKINSTLSNIRNMLSHGGVLIVNEITRSSLFATMTFGLLDNWWQFKDSNIRQPHSPLLDIASWGQAFRAAGLEVPLAIGWDGTVVNDDCQALLIADCVKKDTKVPVQLINKNAQAKINLSTSNDHLVRKTIIQIVASILGLNVQEIEIDRPFAELGVDSIVAGQLATTLTDRLGVTIQASVLFDYATVTTLTQYAISLGAKHQSLIDKSMPMITSVSKKNYPDIAIVGMACRFPKSINLEKFWCNLIDGVDCITEIPDDRFNSKTFSDNQSKKFSHWGGFLDNHDCFDAEAFRINPNDAGAMSPQQRVFLECAWHALEDAGYGQQELAKRAVGVYVGVAPDGYGEGRSDTRSSLGESNAILSSRLSYILDLKGPCLPIDTACSSSLVAIHLAAQAIANGEADMMLAGGVSIFMTSTRLHEFLTDSGMSSASGRCRTFDSEADGFVPGEGVGVVVLKRLDRALTEGDCVIAILKGSGINHDGRTSGITAPSGPAQTELIRTVMARAEVNPTDIGYVEAHGTGTKLGDPIEVNALTRAYGAAKEPCWLGSVKTNIGHTLTTAGVAGFIKAALAVQRGIIPPSLHYHTDNAELNLTTGRFRVPLQAVNWDSTEKKPRRAAVSSFGFSGTNSHAVVEQAPFRSLPKEASGPRPVFFSARTESALEQILARISKVLECEPASFPALAFTLTAGRSHFEHRAGLIASSIDDLQNGIAKLRKMNHGEIYNNIGRSVVSGTAKTSVSADPIVAFLSGEEVDLVSLFPPQERFRVPLPGYPFQSTRFIPPKKQIIMENRNTLHPLIVANISDASGLRWKLAESNSWPPLRDHRRNGKPIIAAAVILEIIQAVAKLAFSNQTVNIADITFQTPLSVEKLGKAAVAVFDDGDNWQISIVEDGTDTIYAKAFLIEPDNHTPDMINLSENNHLSGNSRVLNGEAIYAALANVGFDYGQEFRTVERVQVHDNSVIADLKYKAKEEFTWQPTLIDGAIQSAVGLALGRFNQQQRTIIPIEIGKAALFSDLKNARHAIVTEQVKNDSDRLILNIAITDQTGKILAQLDKLVALVANVPLHRTEDAILSFVPRWSPASKAIIDSSSKRILQIITPGQRTLNILGEQIMETTDDWKLAFQCIDPLPTHLVDLRGLVSVSSAPTGQMVDMIAGWLQARPGVPLHILRVHTEDGRIDPYEAGLEGLAVTLPHEAPEVSLRILSLGRGAGSAAEVIRDEVNTSDFNRYVRRFANARHVRIWEAKSIEKFDTLPDRPVVLITGARGGIGSVVALHLDQSRNARLVLVGRHGASKIAKQISSEVIDITADIGTVDGARTAISAARQKFGRVDVIIHAAGVTGDQLLRNQTSTAISAIMAPKLDGLRYLLNESVDEPLCAVIGFGSLATRFGKAGQGGYAAANAAMAALAERDGLPLRVIDWPFWQTGGMGTREDSDYDLRRTTGSRWILQDEGLALLDKLMSMPYPRLAVAAGNPKQLTAAFTNVATTTSGPIKAVRSNNSLEYAQQTLKAILAEVIGAANDFLNPERTIEDLSLDSMHVMTLNERLEDKFLGVPPTLFYSHRTIGKVADFLASLPITEETNPSETVDRQSLITSLSNNVSISNRQKNKRKKTSSEDPIAIIGMAGRFPGASNLASFWDLLREGKNLVTEIPEQRWKISRYHDDTPGKMDRSYSRWGGFIKDIDMFDPVHFGIAPADAIRMDPQERIVLEVASEAIENAALTRNNLTTDAARLGSVHIGVMYGDYQLLAADQHLLGNPITASAPYWSIANRLSYWLDLHGPSMAVDSACSSSLTAIHLACQSLWRGEVSVAIAGGVNLSIHPLKYIGLSQGRFASTDGRCRSFAEGGDGYVPGEGVGIVVLKLLSEALDNSDPIHAIIRGSAVTHGGRTNGYTVPSPDAQATAISTALERAGVSANQLGFLEAHGTGTALGDPIELDGITRATVSRTKPLPIGTIKASIGHLEAAAGIAGLARLVLQFHNNAIAPTILHAAPSKSLKDAAEHIRLVTELEDWPSGKLPRVAGISSFGAGGANAHLIIEEAPAEKSFMQSSMKEDDCIFIFSGRNRVQLEAEVDQFLAILNKVQNPINLARTLQLGREPLFLRIAVLAKNVTELSTKLSTWRNDDHTKDVFFGNADSGGKYTPSDSLKLKEIAQEWTKGALIDWQKLPLSGKRIRIPPRPLLRQRFWPNLVEVPVTKFTLLPEAALHLTVDNPILRDHKFQHLPLLPGAASLLLMANGSECILQNISFLLPGRPTESGLELKRQITNGKAKIFSQGDIIASADLINTTEAIINPISPPLANAAYTTQNENMIYNRFRMLGIDYGITFQRLTELHSDGNTTEAYLKPIMNTDTMSRQVSDIDATFQAIGPLRWNDIDTLGVPVAINSVALFRQSNAAVTVRAKRISDSIFDAEALDAQGNAVIQIKGLRVGKMPIREQEATNIAPRLLTPVWLRRSVIEDHPKLGRVVLIGMNDETQFLKHLVDRVSPLANLTFAETANGIPDCDTVIMITDLAIRSHSWSVKQAVDATSMVECVGNLARQIAASIKPPKQILLVTVEAYDIEGKQTFDPNNAGLVGLLRSLVAELPSTGLVLFDLERASVNTPQAIDRLLQEPVQQGGVKVAWRGDIRYIEALSDITTLPNDYSSSVITKIPLVCLITGGSGGIGLALAQHLLATRNAIVVLSGRREDPAITLPEGVTYQVADVTDYAALAALCDEMVRIHGRLDIVFHLPLVLNDGTLASMSAVEFSAPLAPKARGTANVLEVAQLAGANLAVIFSSANVFAGVSGQANYVAASCMQDAIALSFNGNMRVQVINWGLWGEIGAVADAATQAKLRRGGIYPISPKDAFQALDDILASGIRRVAVVAAESKALSRLGWRDKADLDTDLSEDIAAFRRLEAYGRIRLASSLVTRLNVQSNQALTVDALASKLRLIERLKPLFSAIIESLCRADLASNHNNLISLPKRGLDLVKQQQIAEDAISNMPHWIAGPRVILDAVLDVYPDLLSGNTNPLSVLFPGGKSDLIASAYRGNPISDNFNTVTAKNMISALIPEAVIIEIGGGTGGGTAAAIAALDNYAPPKSYIFTDISTQFLDSAFKKFSSLGRPWFKTALYDVEETVEANSQIPGSADIVLATNVLHAVANLPKALRELGRLLKPGGTLIVNELIEVQDFATMVFGLTDGWWRGAGSAERLPNSPIIDSNGWHTLLKKEGYQNINLNDLSARGGKGQAVIVANAPSGLRLVTTEEVVPVKINQFKPQEDQIDPNNDDLQQVLIDDLRSIIANQLAIDPTELRANQSLGEYGLESLSSMAVRDVLDAKFGGVSQTLMFEHDTLKSLANHLISVRPTEVRAVLQDTKKINSIGESKIKKSESKTLISVNAPIAVIGMAGRFPGADTPDALWQLLENGLSMLGPVPAERWKSNNWYDPNGGKGLSYTKIGGFLPDIDCFDPLYFGISPVDAPNLDPQERLFLQTAWHALESAGSTPARLQRKAGPVGVFVGVMNAGYQWLSAQNNKASATSSYWSIANRLSYVTDWTGPSLAVDTACSSSLTALHLAVNALRDGQCGAAVVGGVNLIVHPKQLVNLSEARMLSPSGECRSFGEGADGFVDGEGVAAIVIKPLDTALRDNDRIDAIIRGTAINAGGRTSSFSVPNPIAQSKVAADALANAGIDPITIQVVETHGTGTSLGDPIEANGLSIAYGGGTGKRVSPLIIGALKANIGHLESAAGIAGVVKAILQLRYRKIAPLRNAAALNPRIDLEALGLYAPPQAMEWSSPENCPRRIAVSSFGAGGANAHVVLEEAPAITEIKASNLNSELLVLSTMNADKQKHLSSLLRDFISEKSHSHSDISRICHSLRVGRRALRHRFAIPIHTIKDLLNVLNELALGQIPKGGINGNGSSETVRILEESSSGQTLLKEKLAARDFDALARLWVDGADINWDELPETNRIVPIDLPGTIFAKEKYWLAEPVFTSVSAKSDMPVRFIKRAWQQKTLPPLNNNIPSCLFVCDSNSISINQLSDKIELPDNRIGWDKLLNHMPIGSARDLVLIINEVTSIQELHYFTLATLIGLSAIMARPGRLQRVFLTTSLEKLATIFAAIAASVALEGLGGRIRTILLPKKDFAEVIKNERAIDMPGAPLIDRRGPRAIAIQQSINTSIEYDLMIGQGSRVLLVGGLGAVGTALIKELTHKRKARVGVIGRREIDSALLAKLNISYAIADITNEDNLGTAVAKIRSLIGGIDFVIDLARIVDDSTLASKDNVQIESVLAVKTLGTELLDRVTQNDHLKAFIVFSSLASWFGLPGAADYAAACAFQDALMNIRSGPGLSLSIAWPQWEYDSKLTITRQEELKKAGLGTIDAKRGLDLIDQALASKETALAVVTGRIDLIESLINPDVSNPDVSNPDVSNPDVSNPDVSNPDVSLMDDAELEFYVSQLRNEAKSILQPKDLTSNPVSTPSSDIAIKSALVKHLKVDHALLTSSTSFIDLGIDSIKALHVAETLATSLSIEVEPALLASHPNIKELTKVLDDRKAKANDNITEKITSKN
ncbi:ptzE [Candidatus Endolissoclinum faulkneri L5]|uniref:PtzE n=1 Tax=Candidatus Endolissoclinum faulkneri L5 TaxID=1401328 RepID=V9TTQ8_9PROT|nr:SDR family NAD(P)-dependent oxidoreductase [Candidatus Endolissoclinum faulkneri]AHC73991.1 ptzE [Candidatus Endolissoclinum faulkneri L5]